MSDEIKRLPVRKIANDLYGGVDSDGDVWLYTGDPVGPSDDDGNVIEPAEDEDLEFDEDELIITQGEVPGLLEMLRVAGYLPDVAGNVTRRLPVVPEDRVHLGNYVYGHQYTDTHMCLALGPPADNPIYLEKKSFDLLLKFAREKMGWGPSEPGTWTSGSVDIGDGVGVSWAGDQLVMLVGGKEIRLVLGRETVGRLVGEILEHFSSAPNEAAPA